MTERCKECGLCGEGFTGCAGEGELEIFFLRDFLLSKFIVSGSSIHPIGNLTAPLVNSRAGRNDL